MARSKDDPAEIARREMIERLMRENLWAERQRQAQRADEEAAKPTDPEEARRQSNQRDLDANVREVNKPRQKAKPQGRRG
jgi:hypothetical protein